MIHIFLLCYNESILLPHTIAHYKRYMPSAKITIYDNESTDGSVEIAKSLGCKVISWSSNNIMHEGNQKDIKNNCWKSVEYGWIIMADMDEWLCITEAELEDEKGRGTTILKITGIDILGESKQIDLSDINLHNLRKYVDNNMESKKLCFLREKISDINYNSGAHTCKPEGIIQYSYIMYYNKHMCNLGLVFLTNKMLKRYERCELMRLENKNNHYINNIEKIKQNYNQLLLNAKPFQKKLYHRSI